MERFEGWQNEFGPSKKKRDPGHPTRGYPWMISSKCYIDKKNLQSNIHPKLYNINKLLHNLLGYQQSVNKNDQYRFLCTQF